MARDQTMQVLDDATCWELLAGHELGRLAVDVGGRPDIFPINYVVDDGTIVFRSGAGTKLAAAVLMRHVAFEIDGYDPDQRLAWSVIVHGDARQIDRMHEMYEAQDLPLFPWVVSDKPNFVRITPASVSGRRYDVVAPDRALR